MTTATFTRSFLEENAKLDDWSRIEPYFDQLAQRTIGSAAELESWLRDYSELMAAIDEVGTDRHVKMTCQTDDDERKAKFLDFIENIEPKIKPRAHELNVKYAECPYSHELDAAKYGVLDRSVRASVEIFREENVPLQTEQAKLSQKYQEVCAAQTVTFDGTEMTLQQLARFQEETDRDLRQRAWEADANRRLKDAERLEDIFDEMIAIRQKIAKNAGFASYTDYAFKAKQRFDYDAEHCKAFHDAAERAAVPAFRASLQDRKKAMGLDVLRPWDTSVDPKGRGPLKPFATTDEFTSKTSRIFHAVSEDLGDQFDEMLREGYLDLESRKGKAPGGYQATYDEGRHPFIFMNAVGLNRDVRTLLHEGGHAFHAYAARHFDLLPYRHSPIEFAEVASFGMEMLTMDLLSEFYEGDELDRAKRTHLEGIVSLFPWVATIDAFQHWIYANPNHARDERRAHWLSLRERFGGGVDYSGYEDALAFAWQRQLHLFEVPLYYIEYGIAKLGALQVWKNALEDRDQAVRQYRAGLALGGSRPLPELFAAAGAKFDFSYETMAPLIELVHAELEKLPV